MESYKVTQKIMPNKSNGNQQSVKINCVSRDHDALLVHPDEALVNHIGDELACTLVIEYLLLGISKLCL
jgi:hypothetical protein